MAAVIERESHTYYPPEQKAHVLALLDANGGNVYQVSEQTGINRSTIQYWIQNHDRYANLRQEKTESLIEKLDKRAHQLIDAIPEKIETASLAATATALGIVIDKSQILKGLPTSITAEVERQELVVILQSALSAELPGIDITPESTCPTDNNR